MRLFSLLLLAVLPTLGLAAGGGAHLLSPGNDLRDSESLKRGAQLFADNCFNCHAIKYMRYQRMGADLGFSEEELQANFMFTTDKVGDTMTVAMNPADATAWFGVEPPDLSLVSRSRSPEWLYTYLLSFYADEKRPFGVNNQVFPDVGMPHVLWDLEGGISKPVYKTEKDASGAEKQVISHLEPADKVKYEAYKKQVTDLVNFLEYVGEPVKLTRQDLGWKVILFFVIMSILTYALKKEYWRDIK